MKRFILFLIIVLVSGCSGTVQQSPLTITTTQLPDCLEGSFCTYTLTAEGGNPPYNWRIADNERLPLDFALQPNGVITGTGSLNPGTSRSISPPFTVVVEDNDGRNATTRLTINVIQGTPQIILLPTEPIIEGVECNVRLATAQGGAPPYSFQQDTMRQGSVPMGTFVDINGSLRGTPTKAGTYTFGICVADTVRASKCTSVTVIVLPPQNFNLTVRWVGKVAGEIYWYKGDKGECSWVSDEIYQCIVTEKMGDVVLITQKTKEGLKFKGWSDACSGTGECKVTMDRDKTVSANWESDTDPFDGTWTGSYSDTSSGPGGCSYNSGGSLSMTVTGSESSFSGSSQLSGVALRETTTCANEGSSSGSGSVSGTVSGNQISGTFYFTVQATGASLNRGFTGTINGDSISATWKSLVTGEETGSFTLTKQ
jgi:hypothetical protein